MTVQDPSLAAPDADKAIDQQPAQSLSQSAPAEAAALDRAPQTPEAKAQAHVDKVINGSKPQERAAKISDTEMSEDEMEKTIKSNPKAWRVYEDFKKSFKAKEAEYQKKTSDLEKKISDLSSKGTLSQADTDKLARLEKQLAEREGEAKTYKQRLAERDFRESDEYRQKFVDPFGKAFQKARSLVSQLNIVGEFGDLERQAQPQDFDTVFNAPPQQRYSIAKSMFGEDMAVAIVRRAEDLDALNESAIEAVAAHSANYEKTSAERQALEDRQRGEMLSLKLAAADELSKNHPEYFSVEHYNDQPEMKAALESGYQYIEYAEKEGANLPKEDQAAIAAVIRGRSAAFPLMVKRLNERDAKIKSLEDELSKFRQTDPGAGDAKPSSGSLSETGDVGGIRDMASRFRE